MTRSNRIGFTLIELLVVITIIVILLALLVPAMDKALYQAALMQCGTSQKAIVTSMVQYAFDNHRRYPDRQLPTEKNVNAIPPHKLADPAEGTGGPGSYDIRPKVKDYMSVNKMFNDPLVEAVDLEKSGTAEGVNDTHVYASIYLWFGWQYTADKKTYAGLYKIGDKFGAVKRDNHNPNAPTRYSVLVSDIDCYTDVAYSSHPDKARLFNQVIQNEAWPFGGFVTVSQWRTAQGQGQTRSPLDLNYGYQDGSVRRLTKVEFEWGDDPDQGTVRIANTYEGAGGWANVPRE